ncbi:MAG: hypothetical protein QOD41_1701 [Cryptosporangiaceae bacterium]|nr:hypothetical protein [Cryptosporangiaceae bacterium]
MTVGGSDVAGRGGVSRRQVLQIGVGAASMVAAGGVAVALSGSTGAIAGPLPLAPTPSPTPPPPVPLPRLPIHSALWIKRADSRILRSGLDRAGLLAELTAQSAQHYGVIALTSWVGTAGIARYTVVFGSDPVGGQQAMLGMDGAALSAVTSQLASKGLRIAALAVRAAGTYDAIYGPSAQVQTLVTDRSEAELQAWLGTETAAGRHLAGLTAYATSVGIRYTAFTVPGTVSQQLRLGLTGQQLAEAQQAMTAAGMRLAQLTAVSTGSDTRYGVLYQPGSVDQQLATAVSDSELDASTGPMAAKGFVLAAIVTNLVQTFDPALLMATMRSELDGTAVGWAVSASVGDDAFAATQGQRRTEFDAPASPASVTERVNIAEGTRAVTAIAVTQLLSRRGLTLDSRIAGYLPLQWARGPGIATMTFRDLFSQVSGFRANAESYSALQAAVAAGVRPADRTFFADHTNFALFRILVPYLDGFTTVGTVNLETATSTAYLGYLNRKVFAPIGIPTVSARPGGTAPSLAYPNPARQTRGVTFGDWTLRTGSRGLQLSPAELRLLAWWLMHTTALLTEAERATLPGWAVSEYPVIHGNVRIVGGELSAQTPGGLATGITYVCVFSTGVELAVTTYSENSDGMGLYLKAIRAHHASWIPAPTQ